MNVGKEGISDMKYANRRREKMGKIEQEYDDKKDFLGGLTEREFYTRLDFNRIHIKNGRMK